MFLGGYERWMLRFWMLRKLDATVLDALIATQYGGTIDLNKSFIGQWVVRWYGVTSLGGRTRCNATGRAGSASQ